MPSLFQTLTIARMRVSPRHAESIAVPEPDPSDPVSCCATRRPGSRGRWRDRSNRTIARGRLDDHASTDEAELPRSERADRFGERRVLGLEDAGAEALDGIIVEHGHRPLDDNRPGVEVLGHEVRRA